MGSAPCSAPPRARTPGYGELERALDDARTCPVLRLFVQALGKNRWYLPQRERRAPLDPARLWNSHDTRAVEARRCEVLVQSVLTACAPAAMQAMLEEIGSRRLDRVIGALRGLSLRTDPQRAMDHIDTVIVGIREDLRSVGDEEEFDRALYAAEAQSITLLLATRKAFDYFRLHRIHDAAQAAGKAVQVSATDEALAAFEEARSISSRP